MLNIYHAGMLDYSVYKHPPKVGSQTCTKDHLVQLIYCLNKNKNFCFSKIWLHKTDLSNASDKQRERCTHVRVVCVSAGMGHVWWGVHWNLLVLGLVTVKIRIIKHEKMSSVLFVMEYEQPGTHSMQQRSTSPITKNKNKKLGRIRITPLPPIR